MCACACACACACVGVACVHVYVCARVCVCGVCVFVGVRVRPCVHVCVFGVLIGSCLYQHGNELCIIVGWYSRHGGLHGSRVWARNETYSRRYFALGAVHITNLRQSKLAL